MTAKLDVAGSPVLKAGWRLADIHSSGALAAASLDDRESLFLTRERDQHLLVHRAKIT